MHVNRQAARSASTRSRLLRSARVLFARRGYAAVGTEEIVRRAGVTRGALYHQFSSKQELFLAVYEDLERGLTERVASLLADQTSPFAALHAGIRVFLAECRRPEIQRIVLVDGPAVLGWERWRAVAEGYGLGLIEAVITAAVEAGEIAPVAVGPLAHVLMGALDEAALLVVRTPSSSDEVAATLELLLGGLRLGADARAGSPARKRSRPARRRG
jgi:AcrR family transcriptional regulator